MCGCFAILLGSAFPRITLFLIWIFSDWIQLAFRNNGYWIVPLIGLLILPYTTLAYVLVWWAMGGVGGFGWFFVALGFFFDITSYAATGRNRQLAAQN